MLFSLVIAFATQSSVAFAAPDKAALKTLQVVESRYRKAHTVQMTVQKTVKLKLLDRERVSEGVISIRKNQFKWETLKPSHSFILIDGKSVWLVDYPEDGNEAPQILKALQPKKSQPHAVVAFLMGSGKLTDGYKILNASQVVDGGTRYELKPKGKDEPVTKLFLEATRETGLIRFLSFEDGLGNITEVKMTDTKFDLDLKESLFEFVPPKGAAVTQVD